MQSNFTQVNFNLYLVLPENSAPELLKGPEYNDTTINIDEIEGDYIDLGPIFDQENDVVSSLMMVFPNTRTAFYFDKSTGKLMFDRNMLYA